MRILIPIEQVRQGDRDPKTRKKVTHVFHRTDRVVRQKFVCATLEGGWPLIEGYFGKKIEVEREEEKC